MRNIPLKGTYISGSFVKVGFNNWIISGYISVIVPVNGQTVTLRFWDGDKVAVPMEVGDIFAFDITSLPVEQITFKGEVISKKEVDRYLYHDDGYTIEIKIKVIQTNQWEIDS